MTALLHIKSSFTKETAERPAALLAL
jgi:hypothetical protein